MQVIIPPNSIFSTPVRRFSEIRQDAFAMIKMVEEGKFSVGLWKEAFALSHSQISLTPKQFFVVNWKEPQMRKFFKHQIIINPLIERRDSFELFKEGCMSMPYRLPVKKKRYALVTVTYWTPGWFGWLRKITETHTGLSAFVFQHELEHFRGVY